ncbi:hypothetical protein OJAV_G00119620 [Oryzias javanicus]|uniref:Shadoo 2 protein n=1 Tax=Oryzias javanicus TaxID=123683 RepID=A0A437CT33_ORYJA|nr:hypothetical protein OJAV_G00119620 [Oryzias javanicus]
MITQKTPKMFSQQKLLLFGVLVLLLAALCPQYACGKRGGLFRGKGKGKGDDEKTSSPQGRGLSKQGLKWAGAAAAGMLGGTGTGYGLGLFGKPKPGGGNYNKQKTASSDQGQRPHHQETQKHNNQTFWKAFVRGAAPVPEANMFVTLGHVLPFLTAAWIRGI